MKDPVMFYDIATDSFIYETRSGEKIRFIRRASKGNGKWVYRRANNLIIEQVCSVCGVVFEDDFSRFNYCPNCGADMRGEQDE